MKVEVSRFNASIFELVYPDKKERAFLRRVDPEFLEALQAEFPGREARWIVRLALTRIASSPRKGRR